MSKASEFDHQPVLFQETLDALAIRPAGIYVDCTVGGGGHSGGILTQLNEKGLLIGIDRDQAALEAAKMHLERLNAKGQWQLVQRPFGELTQILMQQNIRQIDGVLADLGVSSTQIDQAARGFSYHQDGPLDMRMDQMSGQPASHLVNTWSAAELAEIFFRYGEERYARRIAAVIVARRQSKPFATTLDLAAVICEAMPAASRREKQHPARRVFQALRIAVNGELTQLEALLDCAPDLLSDGGRICLITFHSLEDRLVKARFRSWEKPCICPADLPQCHCGKKALGYQLNRKGQTAGKAELEQNARARSARLRSFIFKRDQEE